jgi:hypothetical protein
MFCAPGLVFGRTDGVWSHIHVLRARTRFPRYRGRQVVFSCFALSDLFSTVPERRILFSCFARQDSFSAVPGASGPVFLFCAPGLVFDGTEGIGSRFHVLRPHTRFRRYRGRRVPFSCFARPKPFSCFVRPGSFSAVAKASGPIFILCAPGLVFGGTRASGPFSMFFAPGHIFGGTEGVGSNFNVLRSRTRFRWYRGRLVPFSCFACPDSFSAIPRASGPIFLFCALGLVFGCSGGFGSRFIVLHPRTRFRRYRGRRVPFSCFVQLD